MLPLFQNEFSCRSFHNKICIKMKRLTERHFHMNAQRLVLTQRLSRKRCSLFTNTTIDLTWRKRFSVRTLSLYSRRVVARPSATEATEAVGNSEIVYYKLISFICTSHLISSSWSSGRGCFVYVQGFVVKILALL